MNEVTKPAGLSLQRHVQFGLAKLLLVVVGFAVCFGTIRLWGTLTRAPVLPYPAVSFIVSVSSTAWGSGFAGILCGMSVGGVLGAMRERRASGAIAGLLFGMVAGAVVGCAAGAGIMTVEAILCERGPKGGYVVPNWAFWLSVVGVILSAGFAAARAVPSSSRACPRPLRTVVRQLVTWTAIAAVLGAVAFAGHGSFYQSNGPPMRAALFGFIACGAATFVCLAVGELARRRP